MAGTAAATIHPLIVRISHWINAASVTVLFLSGWLIYNAHPILPFTFPSWLTLGGWLGGALLWHFAAMWLFVANLLVMTAYGLASGRWRRKLLPLSPRELRKDVGAVLAGRLGHDDPAHYNAIQKLFYLGVLASLTLATLSGLAIWKPVQLQTLTALFGGFQGARIAHFVAMAGIAGFLLVHVVMALLVPRSLRAMIAGR
jgi:thiosulfate reductase cytochrome b subunit